jgi:hypothetical protein
MVVTGDNPSLYHSAVLYCISLWYTWAMSQGTGNGNGGDGRLRELDLYEVVSAASQTDYVRRLVREGELRRAVVRYVDGMGFVPRDGFSNFKE